VTLAALGIAAGGELFVRYSNGELSKSEVQKAQERNVTMVVRAPGR